MLGDPPRMNTATRPGAFSGHGVMHRQQTRQVVVGGVVIGGGAPVAIQSTTSTYTRDVDATLAQIRELAAAGCDLVRVAVPEKRDTEALPAILDQSSVAGYGAAKAIWNAPKSGRSTSVSSSKSKAARQRADGSAKSAACHGPLKQSGNSA